LFWRGLYIPAGVAKAESNLLNPKPDTPAVISITEYCKNASRQGGTPHHLGVPSPFLIYPLTAPAGVKTPKGVFIMRKNKTSRKNRATFKYYDAFLVYFCA
jgi:hypothetical protein